VRGGGERTSQTKHLGSQDGDDGLGVDEAGVLQVVQATVSEDLGTGLEPHGLVSGAQLGDDAAKGAKHSPASVDELSLTQLGEGGGVSGQANGVPAVVTSELAGQVGDVGGVGTCEEREADGSVAGT
jgi:hypothetical protein